MKRIAALSLTVASIVILSSPSYAIPLGPLRQGAKDTAEHIPKKAVGGAAEATADHTDDAVKGLPTEAEIPTGSTTPTQMLETGAAEAGLDPANAVQGAPQAAEPSGDWQLPEANLSAPAPAPIIGATTRSVSDQGSGVALPLAGGAALAITYGVYRAIKSRR